MTPHEFAVEMAKLKLEHGDNPEALHGRVDALMEHQLRKLGYGAGIDILDGMELWYA